ncbi:MAG: site-2 protease family protein [Alphaproteobacteria bacterium]
MIIKLIINLVPVFIAIIAHEFAHGYVAYKLGDNTAKRFGRLSLNPIKHIDLFGTLVLPLALLFSQVGFVFGWAKPVPINFHNFKKPKRDMLLVSSAGIIANLYLALTSALVVYLCSFINNQYWQGLISLFFINMVVFNVVLIVFNILPIPPLDGSKIFLGWIDEPWAKRYLSEEKYGLLAIVVFAFILPFLNVNIFGSYMMNVSKMIISWLI